MCIEILIKNFILDESAFKGYNRLRDKLIKQVV